MPVLAEIQTSGVPVKIWTKKESIEPVALVQLENTARLPFVFKHVAVMPDVHSGKGATIGSVIATRGAVCPAAVGVDIGCGMMAVRTDLHADKVRDKIAQIRKAIERDIPVGFDQNSSLTKTVENWEGWKHWEKKQKNKIMDKDLLTKAHAQLGSLGGGNHFIEVCLDTENHVWVMLHSGSRGTGNLMARRHIEIARDLMKAGSIKLPDLDLAYFLESQPEFKRYLSDLHWCQEYAFENRVEMMRRVLRILSHFVNDKADVRTDMEVNCHHNYVQEERHFGKNVLVTRKGAVRARQGELGIIPGSMGAKSFIVRGKGNPDSFESCSHGAGRLMSRTKAKASFTVNDLKRQTEGIECRKDKGVIDEIPGAYKDIETVMKNQSDLVEVVAELKQVLCVKG